MEHLVDLQGFTLAQLTEAYKYHSVQDCPVSKQLACDCLKMISATKGQRASKIRKCLGVLTASKGINGGLEVYEDDDFSEPMLWITPKGDVKNIYASQWQLDIINAC